MNTPKTPSRQDARLDALLSESTITARDTFLQDTLKRIREESCGTEVSDDKIEGLLSAQPVSVSSDFTALTLERIRQLNSKKVIQFPKVLSWAAPLAAVLTLAFIGLFMKNQPSPTEPSPVAQTPFAEEPTAIIANANTDPVAIERSLRLAKELDGAEVFLDTNDWSVIPLLVDY